MFARTIAWFLVSATIQRIDADNEIDHGERRKLDFFCSACYFFVVIVREYSFVSCWLWWTMRLWVISVPLVCSCLRNGPFHMHTPARNLPTFCRSLGVLHELGLPHRIQSIHFWVIFLRNRVSSFFVCRGDSNLQPFLLSIHQWVNF